MWLLRLIALVLGILAAPATFSQNRERDPVHSFREFDPEMNAAIASARRRLPEFLKVLRDGSASEYGVKMLIADSGGEEHIWMLAVKEEGDHFVGAIGNNPNALTSVRKGSSYKVAKEAISDWLYIKGDRIHGGFTMRVMLPRLPQAEADDWRRRMAPVD